MNKENFTVSDVLDTFKVNKYTWFVFVSLGLSMMFDGYDYMIVSYTLKPAAAALGVVDNPVLMGSLSSWSIFGLIIGCAVSGILSDSFGRRRVLVGAIFLYSLLTLPQAFAQNFTVFAIFRVCAGVGLGACIPTVTTYISESTPTNKRAVFVTFGMAFMVVGWVVAGLVGSAITNTTGEIVAGFDNWRLCYIIGAIPMLYAIALFFVMRDTPYWLANKGRSKEAFERLAAIEKFAFDSTSITDGIDYHNLSVPPKPIHKGPAALVSHRYLKITIAVASAYFLGQFVIYGINAWLPTMMTAVTQDPVAGAGLATWQNAAAILSNITCGFIAEAIGRKKALFVGWVASFFTVLLVSWGIGQYELLQLIGTTVIMILLGYSLNYTLTCVQPMMAEAYPTEFRNTGVAWTQAFGRIGAALAPIVLGGILALLAAQAGVDLIAGSLESVPVYAQALAFLCVPCFLGAVSTLAFVNRETKGKSLDQLQQETEGASELATEQVSS